MHIRSSGGLCIILVVAATDEGLSAGGQALGRLVLMLGYRPQGHLAHEGVAPLILLVWPCLMHKHYQRFDGIREQILTRKTSMAVVAAEHMAPWCPQNKNMYGIVEVWI